MDHETVVHPEVEGKLHAFDGVVATIGITGEVGLAHAGDEMFDAAPISDRAGESEENEVAAGNERRRQPARADLDGDFTRERGIGNGGQRPEVKEVSLA